MTDETAEKAWGEFRDSTEDVPEEWEPSKRAFMAGRASRDAEVAELAQMKADLADWEQNGAPAWVAAKQKRESELLTALTESRARFGDMEQRALAAEAVIEKVRAHWATRYGDTGNLTGPAEASISAVLEGTDR